MSKNRQRYVISAEKEGACTSITFLEENQTEVIQRSVGLLFTCVQNVM